MKKIINLAERIMLIVKNIKRDHIGSFAAFSSFFLVLSFFPMIFLIITLIKLSSNNAEKFINIIYNILPYINKDYINAIFNDFNFKPSSVISLSTVFTAWSAGKSFYALSEGFHSILGVKENRSYLTLRMRYLVFAFSFAVLISFLFFIGVFGGKIRLISSYSYIMLLLQKFFFVLVIFIILSILYVFLPTKNILSNKLRVKNHLIASASSSVLIYIYTVLFSVFAGIYIKYSSFYGGIAAFTTAMLWIYGSMYIILLGFRFSVFLSKKNN